MKRSINLSEIPSKGTLSFTMEVQPSLIDLPEEVKALTPFRIVLSVSRAIKGFDVKGKLEGSLELTCSRCGRKFTQKVEDSFSFRLLPTSEITGGEIGRSDLDVKFSDETVLDIVEILREQILLNLPIKPLCNALCSFSSYIEWTEEESRWNKLKVLINKGKERSHGGSEEESFKDEKGQKENALEG